jgi:hypothetical protein
VHGQQGFVVIFLATFCVCLLTAVIGQVLMLDWRGWMPGAEGGRSFLGSVKSAVYTLMNYAN